MGSHKNRTRPDHNRSIKIILASASPRRVELMKELGVEFEVIPSSVDEEAHQCADPRQLAEDLATMKAQQVHTANPGAVVIGADTVVALERSPGEWEQFAKPVDAEDARRMLRALSGRTHVVITGLAVVSDLESLSASDLTEVTFRAISEPEIAEYVATGEPMDKAGAYAIQGGAEGFATSVKGSLTNVIGLPIELTRELLSHLVGPRDTDRAWRLHPPTGPSDK